MDIAFDVTGSFGTTRVSGVNNSTATQISATSRVLQRGVLVKADEDNTAYVYVGISGMTASDGFRLAAGEQVFIEISDLNKVYLLASTTSQDVSVLYL